MATTIELRDVIKRIAKERSFESLLIWQDKSADCLLFSENITLISEKPKILLSETTNIKLKENFNKEILIVACAKLDNELVAIEQLSKFLAGSRGSVRLVFYTQMTERNQSLTHSMLQHCWHKRILNIVILLKDFKTTHCFYNYRPYPHFEVERQTLQATATAIFPNRLRNLNGYPLRTFPDQIRPRSLLYRNKRGEIKMIGYIGRLIETFAKKLNATLKFGAPVVIGRGVQFAELYEMLRNDTVDIPTCVSYTIQDAKHQQQIEFSTYVEITRWFPMLPVSDRLTLRQIYALIFSSDLIAIYFCFYFAFSLLHALHRYFILKLPFHGIWQQLLLNERALFGLSGGTYRMARTITSQDNLLFILMFFAGLLLNTTFTTYLQTYIIYRPIENEINSYEELRQRKLKILMPEAHYNLLSFHAGPEVLRKYSDVFQPIKSISEYERLRDQFNKSAAFSMTGSLWPVFNRKQEYFAHKYFRESEQLTFQRAIIHGVPLLENSIFAESLNDYILKLHDSGILQLWYSSSFYDMIRVGLMSFQDYSPVIKLEAVRMDDLFWIWIGFLTGIAGSFVCFLVEVFCYRFSK